MAIANAIKLINDIDVNKSLRNEMYSIPSSGELFEYLKIQGYVFNYAELEEAVNLLHVKCQTLQEAQDIMHKAEMLKFLLK